MSLDVARNLKEYIQVCTYLAGDLEQAINDLDFASRPGHKIYYAVDFSELYEYIFPSEAYRDFVVFPKAFDDDEKEKTSAKAIQQLILRYILLELDPKEIVLLPPYLLEFTSFIHKYGSELFVELIKKANRLYKRIQEIASESVNDQILRICQKAQQGSLSEEEEKILAQFIEKYGQFQSILENIDSQSSPWQRLKQLDPKSSFKKLDLSSLQLRDETDTEVYKSWLGKLDALRRSESPTSKIDAMAIQMLQWINREWPANQRLVLISRSKYMHEIYKQEIDEKCGNWEATGDYYLLRHPRVFGLVLPVKLSDNLYNRDYLANLLQSINRFLTECKCCQDEDLQTKANLQKQIDEIEEQWQKIQQFAITLGSSTYTNPTEKKELAKRAQIIMDGIRNQFYQGKLVSHLESLYFELDENHEYLRLSLLGLPEPLKSIKVQTNHQGLLAISLNNLFVPYRLYLESDEAIERIRKVTARKDFGLRDFIAFLKQSPKREDSESYLLKAYVWGVVGRWDVAETYCRTALTQENISENIQNEAKYFLAVCISQQRASGESLLEALHLIQDIQYQRENPRHAHYQVEYGIISLKINMINTTVGLDLPTATGGLYILNTYQNQIQSNASLWLTVLKLKLDYYYLLGDAIKIQNLKQEWDELEKALTKIEPNCDNWPPAILDAVAWGKWLLFADEFKMDEERQVLLDMLQKALEKAPPDLEIHYEIQFHIKEIQKKAIQ
jgi:hypothetical protein